MDEAVIARVLDDYNAAVRGEKEDTFGRTSFYGELNAPYYVMKVSNGVVMTSGGLRWTITAASSTPKVKPSPASMRSARRPAA